MNASQRDRAKSLETIRTIRYLLFVPIVCAIAYVTYLITTKGLVSNSYAEIGNNVRIILLSLVAVAVTFGFSRLEQRHDIHLPRALMVAMMLFVAASVVIGDGYSQYNKLWWWDDMLHALAGIMMALVGFLLVYFFNAHYSMRLSPVFVALFAFTFAITFGVVWEIVEFSSDMVFGSDMQRWNLPPGTTLIGRGFQGSGLRDTMSDLIVACIGALGASTVTYFSYKNERAKILKLMRRTFPSQSRRKKA